MPSRDPFPMQSEEARRLEASVQNINDTNNNDDEDGTTNTNTTSWSHMNTDTHMRIRNENDATGSFDDVDPSVATLVRKNQKKQRQDPEASIYDDMDKPSKADEYLETEDEYLDNPVDAPASFKSISKLKQMMLQVHRKLYGDKLPPSETIRTLCLSSTLFFMIGGYWLLRSLKDPVLTALCGVTAIPKAKMLSVAVVLAVVSIYNRLLDHPNLSKHTLFYIFGMFYFCLFTIISILLQHPTMGLPNEKPDMSRILGWVSYCSIESFGSVMVSLFWSFANSNFNLESAKASYGLLVATAQIGSILGPTVVNVYAQSWGVARIYFLGAISMLLLQGCMYMYIKIYGTDETRNAALETPKKKKKGAGVLEGLHLFVKYNYVKGIFAISCLFMVEVTIVDYTMKVLARDHFGNLHPCTVGNSCWDYTTNSSGGMSAEATAAFTTFMGFFGQATNALSFLLSFFGTSAIIRYLGLRLALLLFPSLCLLVIIIVRLNPTLYVVFAAMMVLKANSYALNNPTKEMLYQPTSSAVRYKAKSWIDIFGARGSKAMGSLVTNAFSESATELVANGSLVGMCVASFLIWNARFMGRSFDEYIKSGYIVGGEEDDLNTNDHVELAETQNEVEDTSCGIYDDDQIEENVSDNDHSHTDANIPENDNDQKGSKDQVELV
jgi:ATP:ADP antiporter, AAA family